MFFTLTVLSLFVKITSALQCPKAKKLKSAEAFDYYFIPNTILRSIIFMERQLSFSKSMIIIVFILALLFVSIFLLKAEPHLPLLVTTIGTAVLLGMFGFSWKKIESAIIQGIQTAIMPILILMLIGILIAVWMMSGTVPSLLYYGMDYINPNYFAVSALYVTIIVSMFTGSSFTTVSTIGVALMGIAVTTGISPTLAAGAIISGACFGDKMSPLSDTTNFCTCSGWNILVYTHS
jgi:NhaC family Na+:H+ antiporter